MKGGALGEFFENTTDPKNDSFFNKWRFPSCAKLTAKSSEVNLMSRMEFVNKHIVHSEAFSWELIADIEFSSGRIEISAGDVSE